MSALSDLIMNCLAKISDQSPQRKRAYKMVRVDKKIGVFSISLPFCVHICVGRVLLHGAVK